MDCSGFVLDEDPYYHFSNELSLPELDGKIYQMWWLLSLQASSACWKGRLDTLADSN
jgi:hypothetical protein